MLESTLKRIKLGSKIANDIVYDYRHPENPRFSAKIHETRIDGINEQKDFWQGTGYLLAVLGNIIKHPRAMYEIFFRKN